MEENKLSSIKKAALSVIDAIRDKIINNECDEMTLTESLSQFHPAMNGYFSRWEYINADRAMDILQLGYNRGKFFSLLKEYGIENHKLNNMPIGYKRSDIERLANILNIEYKINRSKLKKRHKSLWT